MCWRWFLKLLGPPLVINESRRVRKEAKPSNELSAAYAFSSSSASVAELRDWGLCNWLRVRLCSEQDAAGAVIPGNHLCGACLNSPSSGLCHSDGPSGQSAL